MLDIVKNFPRPPAELLAQFQDMQAATLHEAMGKRGTLQNGIRPVWPGWRLSGCALTVYARPGDNLMLHKAVSVAKPGDVLVVFTDGFTEGGIWGEVLTVAALSKGIRGLVTDGAVRDTMPLKELGFPVFSRGISMRGTTKLTPGKIGLPITIGNVCINPGDIVVGDNDGVVIIPRSEAEAALKAAREKEAHEARLMERLRAGESTLDILGLQKVCDLLGLKED